MMLNEINEEYIVGGCNISAYCRVGIPDTFMMCCYLLGSLFFG